MIIHSPIISGSLTFADGGTFTLPDNGIYSGSLSGSIQVSELQSSIIPNESASYDLGSAEFPFRDLYLSAETLKLGGLGISSLGGSLSVKNISDSQPAGLSVKSLTIGETAETQAKVGLSIGGGLTILDKDDREGPLEASQIILKDTSGNGNNIVLTNDNGQFTTNVSDDSGVVTQTDAAGALSGSFTGSIQDAVFNGPATFKGNLVPLLSASVDLGSEEFPFRDFYISAGTGHIGDNAISSLGGSLLIKNKLGGLAPASAQSMTLGELDGDTVKVGLNIGGGLNLLDKNDDKASMSVGDLSVDSITLDGTLIVASGSEINYLSGVTSPVQTQINSNSSAITAILSGSTADKDSFGEIITLINSVDTENDEAFAGFYTSSLAAQAVQDGRLTALETQSGSISTDVSDHISDTNNPHNVTREQLNLGEQDNPRFNTVTTTGTIIAHGGVDLGPQGQAPNISLWSHSGLIEAKDVDVTGNLSIGGVSNVSASIAANAQSISELSTDYNDLENIPSGIVSGSSQVSYTGITDKPNLFFNTITEYGLYSSGSSIYNNGDLILRAQEDGTSSYPLQISQDAASTSFGDTIINFDLNLGRLTRFDNNWNTTGFANQAFVVASDNGNDIKIKPEFISVTEFANTTGLVSGSTQITITDTTGFTTFSSSIESSISTEKGRIDAILASSDADKDSFAEIVTLINSVDTTNDTAFAGFVTSSNAAQAVQDGRLDTLENTVSNLSTDYNDLENIPSGIISGSSQVVIGDTTGFSEFSSSVSDTFGGLSSNYEDLVGIPAGIISSSAQLSGDSVNYGVISGSALHIDGDAFISGNLTLGGNITLGDASSDTIEFDGQISSDIVPSTSNTYDLGSTGKKFAELHATNVYGTVNGTVNATNGVVSGSSQVNVAQTTGYSTISSHISSTANPHSVTATQVGLGNVDNTSDADKPISTATQTALDLKATVSDLNTEKDRIDAILASSDADKDSFAEIVTLINSVDTTNDSTFGGFATASLAAQAVQDGRLSALETETGSIATEQAVQDGRLDALESTLTDNSNGYVVQSGDADLFDLNVYGSAFFDDTMTGNSIILSNGLTADGSVRSDNYVSAPVIRLEGTSVQASDNGRIAGNEVRIGSLGNELFQIDEYGNTTVAGTLSIAGVSNVSASIAANATAISGLSTDYGDLENIPVGIVSGSSQVILGDVSGFNTFSSSVSDTFDGLSSNYVDLIGIPVGIVSGSSQIDVTATTNYSTVSSHISSTSNPHSVTKSQVGLGNVTNESKATMFSSPTFTGTVSGVTATHVGLGNVDNTSDANKPISTATQTALDLKATVSALNTEKGRIDAILASADADKDSFAEIVTLINSVDTTNDSAFAGFVTSSNAAQAVQDGRLDTLESAPASTLDVVTSAGNTTTNSISVGAISGSAVKFNDSLATINEASIRSTTAYGMQALEIMPPDMEVAGQSLIIKTGNAADPDKHLHLLPSDFGAANATTIHLGSDEYHFAVGPYNKESGGSLGLNAYSEGSIKNTYKDLYEIYRSPDGVNNYQVFRISDDTVSIGSHTSITNTSIGTNLYVSGVVTLANSTASTSPTTGALKVTGGVGIGGSLNVNGDIVAYSSSDRRLKDNIVNIENPIEKVQKLNGVTWDWNDNADASQKSLPNVGVIAQEVEEVLPQLVKDKENGYKAIDYAKLTGLLIEAIKEQQVQIEELKSKIG